MDSAHSPRARAQITPLRSIALSEITLDMQRHIVIVDDRDTSQKRRYLIETSFKTRGEGYCYVVAWKPQWETSEQTICSGTRFETADLAVSSALHKIEAWERWLEASNAENR